jgi:hypothetical protein
VNFIPFLVATGPCGLPKAVAHATATGDENVGPLTPSAIAQAYWLLHTLTVSYDYAVEDWGTVAENFSCTVGGEPRQRLLGGPVFSRTATDPATGRMAFFSFQPGTVHEDGATGQYFYKLQLWDGSYPDQEVFLATELAADNRLLATATAQFLGKSTAFYLQATPFSNFLGGSIGQITLTAIFH